MMIVGFLAAIVASISWAVSAAFYKIGAKNISPLTSNLIRILLPLLIFAIVSSVFNLYAFLFFLTISDLLFIFTSGLFAFVIGDALYFVTIQRIGVSRGVPVTSTYPFFVLLLQILFLAQPVHILMIPAMILTVTGVAIIGRQLDAPNEGEPDLSRPQLLMGLVAGIATAFTWSISTLFLDVVLDKTNLFLVAVLRLTFTVAILTPIVVGQQVIWKRDLLTKKHWIYLSLGGTVALAVGYVGFALALQLVDTTSASVLSSLTPLFALVIGWRSLKERVNTWTVLAVVASVVGVALITLAVYSV
jgi:DME family drug/metabolite transporter